MYSLFRLTQKQYPIKFSIRYLTTNPHLIDLPKNLNVAKLIGVVTSQVYTTTVSKGRFFYMRTYNPDKFYDTHKIMISPYVIESLPGIPQTGQKILVIGNICTKKFILNNGKNGTAFYIMAKQIYLCADDGNESRKNAQSTSEHITLSNEKVSDIEIFYIKDQNRVDVLAQICFEIQNEATYSCFVLSLHHRTKNSEGTDEERTNFIPVFVYHESLRNIVRNQLCRLDRVRIEGVSKYKACVDETGKKQYKGHIEADNIIAKLISFPNTISQKVKSAAIK